ncbi:RluA family pseudouridine synthase [Aliarcobacter vitoriensis]|uniref:Pseudouridine synthase n=1 Tax=Aliarcobacter vitoriensis TaxID=2011099 RepID=A0A366MSZ2_9BACT|nr:RluA family pseudouridine synthase [Aliarcobacter vitoriensis]RBQ29386.1 RluA family pseudouridine synthase [Aliarcobacter vitoriensis]
MYKNFIVEEETRLDKFLSSKIEASRNQIEQLIKKDFVKVDGKTTIKNGLKLKLNQNVEVFFPENELSNIKDIDFIKNSLKDKEISIIYEDDSILIVNKPINLTIHDAPSVKDATLVDWLKLKNISLSTISGEERHGIVHRLDKGTSGIIIIAKTNQAHLELSKQLETREAGRYYLALIDLPLKDNIVVEEPIARNPNNRLRMAIVKDGRYSKTAFCKLETSKNEKFELIACKLSTGRTHQIRVHLNSLNRHIIGDNLYGFKSELSKIDGFFLHAYCLVFTHPVTKEKMSFTANIPKHMVDFLDNNFNMERIYERIETSSIFNCFNFSN